MNNFQENEIDPAAEFIAREQNDLAGLEDDIKPTAQVNGEAYGASTSPTPSIMKDEPEKIKKWRSEQKRMLEEKDKAEEIKKEEWRVAAKAELEEWYSHHYELLAKTQTANRQAEKQFVAEDAAIEPGTEWERIAKLCDFNPKSTRTSKDVSRLRSIILQLKQSPLPTKLP